MKAVSVFLLFAGMFLIVQGYYSQKAACPAPKVQVKYIPRSLYDEQLAEPTVEKHFRTMFEDVQPWPTVRG
jgi:hypothetical protein